MDVSVIIPVRDDPRVHRLIAQVQSAAAEPVVVCNGSRPDFVKAVRATGASVHVLTDRNLGRALDLGIVAAACDAVILMDSDCTFVDGAVDVAKIALSKHPLVRGECLFDSVGGVSDIVAAVRRITTTAVRGAYKPPLAMRREEVAAHMGHFFDHDILWCEDAEFDARRLACGLEVYFEPAFAIHHRALTVTSDLRSAWRYGRGYARSALLGLPMRHYERRSLARRNLAPSARAYLGLFEAVEQLSTRFWLIADRKECHNITRRRTGPSA